jgi:hypothetical protein
MFRCWFGHDFREYHRHNKLFRKCTRCPKREFVCNCLPVEPYVPDKVESSKCCGAPVSVGGEKDGTMFYICRECFKPCDVVTK